MQADTVGRLWIVLLSAHRPSNLSMSSVPHGTSGTTLGRIMFLRCVARIENRVPVPHPRVALRIYEGREMQARTCKAAM
jgi:hypothetical protein